MSVELELDKIYTIVGDPTELGKSLKMKSMYYQECIFKGIMFKSIHTEVLFAKQNVISKPVYVFDHISIDPSMCDYYRNKDGTLKTTKIVLEAEELFMNYTFELYD